MTQEQISEGTEYQKDIITFANIIGISLMEALKYVKQFEAEARQERMATRCKVFFERVEGRQNDRMTEYQKDIIAAVNNGLMSKEEAIEYLKKFEAEEDRKRDKERAEALWNWLSPGDPE